ncbi:histidine--tRNA ligase [Candidatus Parcubacteria bacterium]|nr:histidine--tRNA ligase [Candidatus Parcubacteria bacterium]
MAKFPKQLLESPSGFPELTPKEAIAQMWMLDVIRKHFELAGYSPIETPLVERTEVVSAKSEGEIKNQVYGLRLLNPAEDSPSDTKDLALRFDHTVPLARFIAAHYRELSYPFRRYVIGSVFRGERPKEGRYRQFIQADIDAIGDGTLDVLHDAEMVAVINGVFSELALGNFSVRIGNRKVLQGLLESLGAPPEHFSKALGVLDRLEKIGRGEVAQELASLGISKPSAESLLDLLTSSRSTDEVLAALKEEHLNNMFEEGVSELEEVVRGVRALSVPENRFVIDLSIARGLEYYTGTVFETRLSGHEDLGSIASGGRYDDLGSTFAGRNLPGVGISIGVTRLLLRLIKAGLVETDESTIAKVLVTTAEGLEHADDYLKYAAALRAAGIPCEVYLADRPLDKQLAFANKRGFTIAVIAKAPNLKNDTVIIRNLVSGDQQEVSTSDLVSSIKSSA